VVQLTGNVAVIEHHVLKGASDSAFDSGISSPSALACATSSAFVGILRSVAAALRLRNRVSGLIGPGAIVISNRSISSSALIPPGRLSWAFVR
jgi:hypothetical protein